MATAVKTKCNIELLCTFNSNQLYLYSAKSISIQSRRKKEKLPLHISVFTELSSFTKLFLIWGENATLPVNFLSNKARDRKTYIIVYWSSIVCICVLTFWTLYRSKWDEPTCQDSAGHPRDALDLRHVVGCEVLVACSIEERWVTEHAPQLGGDNCPISCLSGFGTHIKRLPHQSTVAQKTHTAGKRSTKCLSGHCCSGWCVCVMCKHLTLTSLVKMWH